MEWTRSARSEARLVARLTISASKASSAASAAAEEEDEEAGRTAPPPALFSSSSSSVVEEKSVRLSTTLRLLTSLRARSRRASMLKKPRLKNL